MTRKVIKLSLDEEAVEVLQRLRRRRGHNTLAEVLRDALGTYNGLAETLDSAGEGCLFGLHDRQKQTFQELKLPALARQDAAAIDALIARSSIGQGLRAMKEDPERHLAELERELTPEVMAEIRRANGKGGKA